MFPTFGKNSLHVVREALKFQKNYEIAISPHPQPCHQFCHLYRDICLRAASNTSKCRARSSSTGQYVHRYRQPTLIW